MSRVKPESELSASWTSLGETLQQTCAATSVVALLDPDAPCMLGNPFQPAPEPVPAVAWLDRPTKVKGQLTIHGPDMVPDLPKLSAWDNFCDFLLELISVGQIDTLTFNWKPDPALWKDRAVRLFVAGGSDVRDEFAPLWARESDDKKRIAQLECTLLRALLADSPSASESDLKKIAALLAPELDTLYGKNLLDEDLYDLQRDYLAGKNVNWSTRIDTMVSTTTKQRPTEPPITQKLFDGQSGYHVDNAGDGLLEEGCQVTKDGKSVAWNDPEFAAARREAGRRFVALEKLGRQAQALSDSKPDPDSFLAEIAEARRLIVPTDSPRLQSIAWQRLSMLVGVRARELNPLLRMGDAVSAGREAFKAIRTAEELDPDNVEALCLEATALAGLLDSTFSSRAQSELGIRAKVEAERNLRALQRFQKHPQAQQVQDVLQRAVTED